MSTLTAAAISAAIQATLRPNLATLSGNTMLSDSSDLALTVGSAVGSADGAFTVTGNVSAGTPVVIDLTTLKDPFGNALTDEHIVGLKITNTTRNLSAGSITHGGGTNPIYPTASLPITPTDFYAQSFNGAGLVVTPGSAQNLQLLASAGTLSYQVTALVRSG